MELKESNKINTYHIQVKEAWNHHTSKWFGNLTLITKENEGAFLDISFTDQEVLHISQVKPRDRNQSLFSIETIEAEDLK